MKSDQLALVQGWPHTRATLQRWNATPWRILGPWALGALVVALGLLAATMVVAAVRQPDPTLHSYPGITRPATLQDFAFVLRRNFDGVQIRGCNLGDMRIDGILATDLLASYRREHS